LIRGAIGEIKADLIIAGGKLVNVYSGEILDGQEIAVLDGRICYVGPSAKHARGESTEVLDANGMYVAPGFIVAIRISDTTAVLMNICRLMLLAELLPLSRPAMSWQRFSDIRG